MDIVDRVQISSPYIIAIGPDEKNTTSYYIVVKHQLITVIMTYHIPFRAKMNRFLLYIAIFLLFIKQIPRDYNFLFVLDLFLKTHLVFKISFDEKIRKLMQLLQYYIYKIKTIKLGELSLKMKSLCEKLEILL